MTNSINAPIVSGFSGKAAGRLSMISMLAISVGIAAAPAQAQDMIASPAPAQASPVIAPQPAQTEPAPAVTPTRADDLATKGGFDAATVAPEALAQIERDQQARKDAAAAAKSAAAARAAAAASKPAPARATGAPVTDSATQAAPAFDAVGSAALAQGTADPVAVIPMIAPVPQSAAAPEAVPADGETDWSLLAALAAMLGIGSAGAYTATRRRRSKSKTRQAAALNAAIMPELRRAPVEPDIRPAMDAAPTTAQPIESKVSTKVAFADFVANLPAFEAPLGKADSSVTNGQRRVAAAPRPYLAEADMARPEGYFAANVDAMPTPQNPFLTRQKRVKRARYLDGKLAERKASRGDSRAKETGAMRVARPLEAALH